MLRQTVRSALCSVPARRCGLLAGLERTLGSPVRSSEADLYDYGTWATYSNVPGPQPTGDWKGKSRMIHASGATSWFATIVVAQDGWKLNSTVVGTVQPDPIPDCMTNYHVHHDFMPPTTGQLCLLNKNTILAPTGPITPSPNQVQTGKRKENPEDWVHSLTHQFGSPCVNLGSYVADILLGTGGVLNDTGAGTYALANGPEGTSITTPQKVAIPGTYWEGYVTAFDNLLVGAYCNSLG